MDGAKKSFVIGIVAFAVGAFVGYVAANSKVKTRVTEGSRKLVQEGRKRLASVRKNRA